MPGKQLFWEATTQKWQFYDQKMIILGGDHMTITISNIMISYRTVVINPVHYNLRAMRILPQRFHKPWKYLSNLSWFFSCRLSYPCLDWYKNHDNRCRPWLNSVSGRCEWRVPIPVALSFSDNLNIPSFMSLILKIISAFPLANSIGLNLWELRVISVSVKGIYGHILDYWWGSFVVIQHCSGLTHAGPGTRKYVSLNWTITWTNDELLVIRPLGKMWDSNQNTNDFSTKCIWKSMGLCKKDVTPLC